MIRRWGLPALLGAVSAVAGGLALDSPAGRSVPTGTAVASPVLSARRVPALLSQTVADHRLRSDVDAALGATALGGAREQSCVVVRRGARPIVDRRAEASLIPASTLKVLTAQAVLARLGPEERLLTEVRAAAPVAADGVGQALERRGHLGLVGERGRVVGGGQQRVAPPDQPEVACHDAVRGDGRCRPHLGQQSLLRTEPLSLIHI